MSATKQIDIAETIDTVCQADYAGIKNDADDDVFASSEELIRARNLIEARDAEATLVGSLVPGFKSQIKNVDWSFSVAELIASEELLSSLECEMHPADACAVMWLYARL